MASWDAAPRKTTFMETVSDIGMVYPAVEAALHAVSALVGGFPAFLGGATGTMLKAGGLTPKAKEVGTEFSEAVTYQPRTERGKRLASSVMYPFQKITEWGEGAGHKVADVTGSPALAGLTEATVQMGAPVLGAKAIARAAQPKGEFKRPEEATGGAAPLEPVERAPSAPPVKLDSLVREAEYLGRGAIPEPPKNLAKLAERRPEVSGTSTNIPLPLDRLIAEAQRAGEGIPEPPRRLADLAERPGSPQEGLALEGGQSRASGARPGPRAQEPGFTPIDWLRADEVGASRAIRSDTKEGGVATGRQQNVNQVLSWLEPERGRGRAEVDATIFDAGREYEKPEAKQRAFNDLYDTLDQDPGLRAEYPEFYTERGQVDKRAVDAVARAYNTYVSTQMNAARRANEGKDTAIHPGSFDEYRGRGSRGAAPPEPPPAAPVPEAPAGEIPPPPRAGQPQSLLGAIRELGGVNMREIADLSGESRTGKAGMPVGVFRTPGAGAGSKNRGYGLDELVPRLRERGFQIPEDPVDGGVGALRDMISQELKGGEKVFTEADAARVRERTGYERDETDRANEEYRRTEPYAEADRLYGREGEIGRPPVDEPIARAEELRGGAEERAPMSDAEALEKYGPGTLGMNPIFDPAAWKDTLKPLVAVNKAGQKLMNNAQAMPESAHPAAAAGYDFARANYFARERAQLDRADNYKDKAAIEKEYKEALAEVRNLDPKYDPGTVSTVQEASAATERARVKTATLELQRELLQSGVGVLPGKAGSLDGFVKPQNYAAFTTPGGRTMYLRKDAAPVLEQMVSGYDWLAERNYMEGWGKLEATSHAITGMLLALPTFHAVTVGGRTMVGAINLPSNNMLRFGKSAWEAMNDRAQMRDMMEHGVTFFPKRQTFDPSGAQMGVVEKRMRDMGLGKPYEGYQWFHNEVLANSVNWMETMYYQWRLNQLTSGHKGHMPPGTLDTYKTMAGRDASNAAANLAKEEGNRTWFRILGNVAFSRGLQVNTVRMATRALEGDHILQAVARRNGMTVEQAKDAVNQNKAFLGRQLTKDYIAMIAAANAMNYFLTSIEEEPNGKKGGHFVWDNQGSDKTQYFLPTNIFVGNREVNGEKVGVYMSTPFRSARDVIEYAMLPYELVNGEPGKVLKNKASVPLKLAEEHVWTGKDYAGRALGGTSGAVGNIASHMTPSPFEDIPRYAMEAWAQGNPTYFSEGLAKVFDPALFPLKAAGMQPKRLKPDPETSMLQTKQLKEEEKVRARASKLKADLFGMSPETRATAIESVMADAERAGMDAKGRGALRRYMTPEGVTRGATKAANRRLQMHPEERRDQISTPPGYD